MKRNLSRLSSFVITMVFCPIFLSAQDKKIDDFMTIHKEINRKGMTVLGSWALGNIAVSSISLSNAMGETKSFHQMNIGWNTVNLLIAGFGYYGSRKPSNGLSMQEALKEHEKMKRIFLFNAGLDIAYMAGGAYLLEKAKNEVEKADQWRGFGRSIIMNGGFLFLFDLTMYFTHQRHGNSQFYNSLKALKISPGGFSLSLRF